MSEEETKKEDIDPMANMIEFYDNWTKAWASTMSDAVASERFAQSAAEQMDGGLEFMGFMRKQVTGAMEQYLQQMNLPTRKEVIDLAERLTHIEMTIDDLDAKIDKVLDLLKAEDSN
jgi:hypothetical protein